MSVWFYFISFFFFSFLLPPLWFCNPCTWFFFFFSSFQLDPYFTSDWTTLPPQSFSPTHNFSTPSNDLLTSSKKKKNPQLPFYPPRLFFPPFVPSLGIPAAGWPPLAALLWSGPGARRDSTESGRSGGVQAGRRDPEGEQQEGPPLRLGPRPPWLPVRTQTMSERQLEDKEREREKSMDGGEGGKWTIKPSSSSFRTDDCLPGSFSKTTTTFGFFFNHLFFSRIPLFFLTPSFLTHTVLCWCTFVTEVSWSVNFSFPKT